MKIQLSELTTERKWRAATGFDKQRFEKLMELFKEYYVKIYGKPVRERQVQTDIDYCLTSEEELLFFTLCSLKSGLTYDLLGVVCGMEASNAKRNQKTGVEVLQRIFQELGYAPKRKFMNINEFLEYFADTEELIIDATEQRIQRPSDKKSQKQYYSGKKNAYDKSHDY
ncbi:MAG TPA: hypothetical protein VJ508_08700 [Saprospiraceae bacterium]|nr:hypothetical protein [Saprospiraceae bacterium]